VLAQVEEIIDGDCCSEPIHSGPGGRFGVPPGWQPFLVRYGKSHNDLLLRLEEQGGVKSDYLTPY